MEYETVTVTATVGALIRGRVKREVMEAAWGLGLSVDVEESKGMLESVYRFTIRGDYARVEILREALDSYAAQVAQG